jgi:nucleoside-diphosphate-sugar epimerase
MTGHKQRHGHEYKGARVLITGGLGFIGSNLARALVQAGADVTLVDSLIPEYGGNRFNVDDIKERVRSVIADVRNTAAMHPLVQAQDYLFNLAGQTSHLDSMTDPFTDVNINCVAQLAILEVCRAHNPRIKIVYASTRQIYGKPQYLPVDERHLLQPVDVNGINKMAGEWYHILYHNVYGLRTTALRLTNTYGPGMRVRDARQTFLGVWIKNVLTGQPVDVYGDGQQRRDFNHVDDVVDALLLTGADERANGQVYNLGSEEVRSLEQLAALLVKVNGAGTHRLIAFPPERKAIDIGDYYADFSKIKSSLGWTPRVALADGLARTLAYYRAHGEHYWDTRA